MDGFTDSLLEKIEDLLSREIGDATRLKHIRKSILDNKKLYNSDIQYVRELEKKNLLSSDEPIVEYHQEPDKICWNCKNELGFNAKFCFSCGADQEQKGADFTEVLSRRRKMMYNPLKIILGVHSYQILSIIGGVCALVPILYALLSLDRLFEIIEFYTNRNFAGLVSGITALGIISSAWSFLVMIIPLIVKKPKKVGKFLFFSSFGILVCSLVTGIVGFVMILFAGILALKKRRY
jgi:hypothetical protein